VKKICWCLDLAVLWDPVSPLSNFPCCHILTVSLCPLTAKKLLSLDLIQCNLNYRVIDYKIGRHTLVISSEPLNSINQ